MSFLPAGPHTRQLSVGPGCFAGYWQRCAVLSAIVLVAAGARPSLAQNPTAPNVEQAMTQGSAAMKAGNFSVAAADYTEVTRAQPGFAEGYFNLGLALEQAGRLDDARNALEKALRLKPAMRGANMFVGIIDYRENRFQEAESRLLRETEVDSHNAKAFMWLGVCRLAENDPHGAIGPLDKAYALDATDVDILYHRGRAYLLMSSASFDAMYKLDADSLRVHQVLGEAYAQAFRTQDAINEFERAIQIAPAQPGLHEELADQYWILGKLDQAAATYREELAIDPHAATDMYKLGSLLVLNQNPDEGVKMLRAVLHEDSSLSDAHYYLGTGLMALHQEQDAINEFQLAIAADPSDRRAMSSWYKLALIYRNTDAQKSQTAMQKFLQIRAEVQQRQAGHTSPMIHKRTDLPVADPEKTQAAEAPGNG
jgi:tetratricopeptide (TPR) repeat protein